MADMVPRVAALGDACCGCGACAARCPKSCIEMLADECGFLRPEIDSDACVRCEGCDSVCPVLSERGRDDVVAVALGGWHSSAIKSDGSLFAWGLCTGYGLGDGTTEERHTPVQIEYEPGKPVVAAAVALGVNTSAAITPDGSLLMWGANFWHQLGDGTTTRRLRPAVTADGVLLPGNGIRMTATLDGVDWSAVYDPAYYATANPDVATWAKGVTGVLDGQKLLRHFVNNGRKEGRASKEDFELTSYYNANPDLRKAFGTDWARYYDHYRTNGKTEGRVCTGVDQLQEPVTSRDGVEWSAVYDASFYAQSNSDVADWATRKFSSGVVIDDTALLQHFTNSGAKEARRSKEDFDVKSYFNANPDLRAAFGGSSDWSRYYRHYAANGAREGRTCADVNELQGTVTKLSGTEWSAVYDEATYAQKNNDVANWATRKCGSATVLDDYALLSHFVNNGRKEGRASKAGFELASYYNANADLRRAFGTDWARYYDHYRTNGQREGRTAAGVDQLRGAAASRDGVNWAPAYDANFYAQHNPDVANWAKRTFASGSVIDDAALLNHFVGNGAKESRASKEGFDVHAYRSKNADLARAFGNDWKSYYRHYAKFGVNEHRACA